MGIDYKRLPQNQNGDPEYASVCLTLDARIPARGNHVIDKFVSSTQSPEETLTNLFSYYKEDYIKEMETTAEAIGRGYNNASAYIYVTKTGEIQIVMASVTFTFLVNDKQFGDGSSLVAMEKLKGLVTAVIDNAANANEGEVPPVHCIMFTYGAVDPEAEKERENVAAIDSARDILANLSPDQLVELAEVAGRMNALAEAAAANAASEG